MKRALLRRLTASPLALALALDTLALTLLALAETSTLSEVVRADPGVRVAGLALVFGAWNSVHIAPRTSTGHRRAVAVCASVVTLCVGILHGVGMGAVLRVEALGVAALTAPWREGIAAGLVAVFTAWVWATSPAVRG